MAWMNDLLARYPWILTLLYLTGLLLICWLLDRVVRRWALRLMSRFASRTRTRWDDMLFNEGVFNHLSHMVPVALAQLALPLVPGLPVDLVTVGRNVLTAYMVLLAAMAGSAALSAALRFLGQAVPQEISAGPVRDFWPWAIATWSIRRIPALRGMLPGFPA